MVLSVSSAESSTPMVNEGITGASAMSKLDLLEQIQPEDDF